MEIRNSEIELLLCILDEAYEKQAWHGPNLRGSLRGVSVEQAAWRPDRERHNIWEIAVHAAYWKYAVRRRLQSEKRGSFPMKGSNWFKRPEEASESAWISDLRLLRNEHLKLRQTVTEFPLERLYEKAGGSKVSNIRLVYGVAAHDVYHAGQIQFLKRLSEGKG
jgi:uncharacterized damage-inducible protein DinB